MAKHLLLQKYSRSFFAGFSVRLLLCINLKCFIYLGITCVVLSSKYLLLSLSFVTEKKSLFSFFF